ncbi:MAG TPA: SDR family oxidoreductase [Micromonosporaceae bacterium]|nr:SDR family oxidoreductase [Micromonosporaceae bacterium]
MSTGGLAGRAVVVTGASSGLGAVVARKIATAGGSVSICARTESRLEAMAQELRRTPAPRVHARALDVTDHAALEAFVRESARALGGLHGLVANVGGDAGPGLLGSSTGDWIATFDRNVGQAVTAVRAAVEPMAAAGGGSVVLVSSISGWKPVPQSPYGVAKAALNHLAACLARELGPQRIRVNAVCPGSMLIPGKRWERMRIEDPEAYGRFAAEFPNGQLLDPEDVANVIAFLLSEESRAINGASVPVDGGQNAPTADGY